MSEAKKGYSVSKLKGLPVLGFLLPALKNPMGLAIKMSQRYGDIISFPVLGQEVIQINHPDLIRYILIQNQKNYKKSKPYVRFESAIGLGLLTSSGDKWRRDRQKIQPMFNREQIAGYYFEVVNEVTEKYKQRWLKLTENGKAEINITSEMAQITTEVILKSIFGKNIDDETVTSLHHSYSVLIEYLKNIRIIYNVDLRKLFCMPSYFSFKKELANIDNIIKMLSQKYREGGIDNKHNMLALLIEAQKADPVNFSEADIRDHAVSMVFAGFETTSILMQWLWYVLDEYPDIRKKLREDIISNAPCTVTADSTSIKFDDIKRMDYLSLVMKETLRVYPPFWITGREAVEDDYFGDFKVKKGTIITLPQLTMHRHPKWWKDPNSFIPERFSPENQIDDGLYFPFLQGGRKCSGINFVDMEARVIIAKLLPLFTVTALNKLDNSLSPGISLKLKNPLMVEISRFAYPGTSSI
jgi:cytochrome P450